MSVPFKGVLGVIGKTTRDGRQLAPHDPAAGPLTRDLPIPIISPGFGPAGRIESVWVDGDLIRYSGLLDDLAAAHVRERLQVAGLDVDRADVQPGPGDDLVLVGWRVAGATMDPYEHRAWPEVDMELEDDVCTCEPVETEIDAENVTKPGDETVSIGADQLHDLRQEAGKLRALEAAGVDNWSGYDYAMELWREERDG